MDPSTKQPLTELSPNTSSPTKATNPDHKFRPDVLKDENSSTKEQKSQSYVSPSDTIMSPTTKKLSEMKGKRFASAKPQSLFAKTVGRQALRSEEKLNQGVLRE